MTCEICDFIVQSVHMAYILPAKLIEVTNLINESRNGFVLLFDSVKIIYFLKDSDWFFITYNRFKSYAIMRSVVY